MPASHFLITAITLFQMVLLPALLIGWQAFYTPASRVAWLLQATVIGAVLLLLDRLLDWSFLNIWGRHLLRLLFGVALVYSAIRVWDRPLGVRPAGWAWLWPAGALLLLLGAGLLLARSRQGRRLPAEPLPLIFPMKGGCYHVAHGGSTSLINGHLKVAAPALHAWRGQMWGPDIFRLYPAGNRCNF